MNDIRTQDTQAASQAKVMAALAELGEATAAAIAERAGLAYSTTTPKLRALQEDGHAESLRGSDRRTLWRLTASGQADADADAAHTSQAPTTEQPLGPAPDDAAVEGPGAADEFTGPEADLEPRTTTSAEPDAAAADPDAEAAGPRQPHDGSRSDAAPAAVTAEGQADITPATVAPPAGGEPAQTKATGASAATTPSGTQVAEPNVEPDAAEPTAAARPDVITGSAANRRPSGSLRGAILDILEAHPDRQYKTGELCKLINQAVDGATVAKASAGAVANAVIKLVACGRAIQTVEKPATFQLAPPIG